MVPRLYKLHEQVSLLEISLIESKTLVSENSFPLLLKQIEHCIVSIPYQTKFLCVSLARLTLYISLYQSLLDSPGNVLYKEFTPSVSR